MQCLFTSATIFFFISSVTARTPLASYLAERSTLLEEESNLFLGSQIELSQDEIIANEILMQWKRKEVDESFANPQQYNFSKHFFSYKNDISKSKVYQMLKKMPKGGALHIHDVMMLDVDSLLKFTYEDHLYACYNDGNFILFHFADTYPSRSCPYSWELLSDLRKASYDVTAFDLELRKQLTMYTEDEQIWNADINFAWKRFQKIVLLVSSLVSYRPVREKYIYESLKQFYKDKVYYIELRTGLFPLYELNGTQHSQIYKVSLYQRVTKIFIKEHPDFVGVKIIIASSRWTNISTVREDLETTKKLKNAMPRLIAGFDLVGPEDKGKPLLNYLPALIEAKDEVDYYFHSGETDWFGTSSDENLIDAVLIGSKRIGHGYALIKHPVVLAAVKRRNIGLEVNVLSNVVLSLVRDVRNHPLASYLALGLPVVLSSDDPGGWDADPLTHDFYVAFVGVASRSADLRLLKQLALNSIQYSALDFIDKINLSNIFLRNWNEFVQELIANR